MILTDVEDFPLDEIFDEKLLRWRRSRKPWPPADGFFFSYDDAVFPEEAFEFVEIPQDLILSPGPKPLRSPIERVLDRLGAAPVTRISSQDDPDVPGQYQAPYPHIQYPDVALIQRKVRDYCLRHGHFERKWEGFAAHGWDESHPDHSLQMASLLASALLLPFEPLEPRVTADGSIQFSALIALPSFVHGYAPVMTAWVARQDAAIQLATAFVVSPDDAALDPTFPFEPGATLAWSEVVSAAVRYGELAGYDGVSAQSRLFISRHGPGNALSRALVQAGHSHGEFRRAAIGGRCVLAPIGPGSGWVQAGRTTAHAQISLGLRGVLSMPGTWVD